jgi:hypothetical protein
MRDRLRRRWRRSLRRGSGWRGRLPCGVRTWHGCGGRGRRCGFGGSRLWWSLARCAHSRDLVGCSGERGRACDRHASGRGRRWYDARSRRRGGGPWSRGLGRSQDAGRVSRWRGASLGSLRRRSRCLYGRWWRRWGAQQLIDDRVLECQLGRGLRHDRRGGRDGLGRVGGVTRIQEQRRVDEIEARQLRVLRSALGRRSGGCRVSGPARRGRRGGRGRRRATIQGLLERQIRERFQLRAGRSFHNGHI